MAVAVRRDPGMGVAEYQEWGAEPRDEERWELIDGEPMLMAPPSERHPMIVANLLRHLASVARDRGGRAIPGIAALSDAMDTFAPIPDVMIRCGPMLREGYARDPVLVAEMRSPSTMSRKTDFCRSIASLRVLLIVYQDEPCIEAWRREAGGDWTKQARGPGETIDLPELGGRLAVADIYDDIDF